MKNKTFPVLLVIVFVLNSLFDCIAAPQTSNAHQNDNDLLSQINKCKTVTEYNANTTVYEMDFVTFGSFVQNIYSDPEKIPIRWIVLEKQNDKALLLSQDVWDISAINSDWLNSDTKTKYDPNTRLQQVKSDYSYKNLDDMKLYIDYSKEFNKQKSDYVANSFLSIAFTNEEIEYIADYDMSTKINSYIYVDEWTADYSQYNERMLYSNVENIIERNKVFQLSIAEYDKYLTSSAKRMSKHHLDLSDDWQGDVYYESRDQYISNRGFYTEVGSPKVVYFCDTGNKYDDASQFVGTSYEQGYRPAIWVKLSTLSNDQVNNNNTLDEINSNNLSRAGFIDANLSKQISNVKILTKYDTKTRIDEADVIRFGTSHNENFANDTLVFEWVVIDKDEENKKALLLSKDIIGSKNWTSKDKYKNKDVVWETSTLRQWLNGDFYQKYFTENEKRSILTTHLHNSNNPLYNTNGGSDTDDKIFLLSIEDIEKYFNIDKLGKERDYRLIAKERNLFKNEDGKKLPSLTTEGQVWWLRSPGEKNNSAAFVNNTGTLSYNGREVMVVAAEGRTYAYGTRPAMWVSYNPKISDSNIDTMNQNNATGLNSTTTINDNNMTISSIENGSSRIGIADSNSLLGDSVNVEGAGVYLNPDGTIQIGGEVQEGSSIIKEGSTKDIDIQYETQDEIDKIISDYNDATLKKSVDRVYYYSKHDATNKMVTSINKKNLYNGFLGLPLFSNKTYYNIEIKLNEATRNRLSKYAESEWNGAWRDSKNWVLLAGDSMNSLENVSWLGISPYTEDDHMVHTEGVSYYQKSKIQLSLLSENEQNRIYEKIKNAKVLILATGNVIKSYDVKLDDEEKLGSVERFEYVKDDESHINLVNAYLDCEDKIIEYTKNHNGNFLYIKDGFSGDLAYHEEIVSPKKECNKFEILVFGNDSLSYSIYGNKVNFLAGKDVGGMKKFEVFGGKMWWEYELDIANGFEDYEKYYVANKDKW